MGRFKRMATYVVALLFVGLSSVAWAQTHVIQDMRGKKVTVPVQVRRVATLDDGFVEQVMTHLGVIDRVVAIGSWSMKRDYSYEFSTRNGQRYEHRGLNTMKYLHPWLNTLPYLNSPEGNVIQYETLARVKPDVVIARVGDCTVRAGNAEGNERVFKTIEALGIPLVVLHAPSVVDASDLSSMREEARVIGSLFGKEKKAVMLLEKLAETEKMIRKRTAGIPDAQRIRLLYLGLNPDVRRKGGAGSVLGINTPENYIIEEIVRAKNAFRGKGASVPISTEQIYALNPDVIVLPTFNGYHPPRELLEAAYYEKLKELPAIKAKKVYAMPWTPMNCSRRLEYPLDMLIIAKAAYPDRFQDVSVYDFSLKLYKMLYGVDEKKAKGLRSTQLLDWMKDSGF